MEVTDILKVNEQHRRTFFLQARYNQNKKHLFSDTDTEYRGDDSKTDISWLQKSKAPSKPQIIDYSRNKNLGKSKRKGKSKSPSQYFLNMLQ